MNKKQQACLAALKEIRSDQVIGIGTGSTVEVLIQLLPTIETPRVFVSSSQRTTEALEALGYRVISFNDMGPLDLYIDGCDQVLPSKVSLKGGGGAHTLEKILAYSAKRFVGIADKDKFVTTFDFPVVIAVIPEARSSVSRHLIALNAQPVYRNVLTDSGHVILDVRLLDLTNPVKLEKELKLIPGVVETGIFAHRVFDCIYLGQEDGADIIT